MNLGRIVRSQVVRVLRYPHRLVPRALRRHRLLAAFGGDYPFGRLLDRSQRLAGAWAGAGLATGDRVLIDLPNDPTFVEARLAALLGGLVAVPVPPGTTDARLHWMADVTGARAYVGARAGSLTGLASTISLDPAGGPREEYDRLLDRAQRLERAPSLDSSSLMTINFTSGTTGDPKGVMSTAAGWGWSLYYALLENRVPITRGEVFLHALPLATAGSSLLLPAVLSGARSLFLRGWDPEEAAELVERERVNRIFLTPTMLAEFADAVRAAGRDVASLKSVVYGTEAAPVARIRKALGVLGGVLQQGYGMAEALPPVAVLQPREHARALADGDDELLSSAGRPTRAVDLRVFGDADRPAEAGETGSIRLKGPTVSPGYWRDPQLTEGSRRGGYYVTGDVGYLDPRGYLHVLGRAGAIPSAAARGVVERMEGRRDVCVAWAEERGPALTLHCVPARGFSVSPQDLAEEVAGGGTAAPPSVRVHARPPLTPSYKLDVLRGAPSPEEAACAEDHVEYVRRGDSGLAPRDA